MFYVIFCTAYSVVNYLNVIFTRLITSVSKEELIFLPWMTCNFVVCLEGFPLPLGAYFIVSLSGPSTCL